MKWIVGLMGLGLIAGCTTTQTITVPKPEMVPIPQDFLICNLVRYPKPETLTDKQVARLLVQLDTALRTCKGNIQSIQKLQEQFQKSLGATPTPGQAPVPSVRPVK